MSKEILEKILNQPGNSVEDVRKKIIAVIEGSAKILETTNRPLYEEYRQKYQARGLLDGIPKTLYGQVDKLASIREFLQPRTSSTTKPRP